MSSICESAPRKATQGPEHPVVEPPQPRRPEPIDDPPLFPDDEPSPRPPEREPPQPPLPLGPAPRRARRDMRLMRRARKGFGVAVLSLALASDDMIASGIVNALQREPNLAEFGVGVATEKRLRHAAGRRGKRAAGSAPGGNSTVGHWRVNGA